MLSPSTMDDAAMTATRSLSSRLACDAFEFKSSFDARDDARNSPARPAADVIKLSGPPSEQDLRDCVGGWIEKVPALDCVICATKMATCLGTNSTSKPLWLGTKRYAARAARQAAPN
jgi:hypothetical protein